MSSAQAGGPLAHVSVETGPAPLGSAGGIAALRDWIDGRDVLVANADGYLQGGDTGPMVDAWDSGDVRMLGVTPGPGRTREFGRYRFAGMSVIPWRYIAALPAEPSDLVSAVWRRAEAAGEFRVIDYGGFYLDCGTPADYLEANLHAARAEAPGGSLIAAGAYVTGDVRDAVIGAGARVEGSVSRAVVWPGATIAAGEHVTGAIRYGHTETVPAAPVRT